MKLAAVFPIHLSMLALLTACGDDAAQVADDTSDGAETATDEVGEEGEEAVDDIDAALDCAAVCDAQDECAGAMDEDGCYETCESVAIDAEGNQREQSELDDCEDCVDAADEAVCDASGDFVCARRCATILG